MGITCTVWINDCLNQLEIILNYQLTITLGSETERYRSQLFDGDGIRKYSMAQISKRQYIRSTFFLRSSVKLSAGQTDQSKVKLTGPPIFSQASGPALKLTPVTQVIIAGPPHPTNVQRNMTNLISDVIKPDLASQILQ